MSVIRGNRLFFALGGGGSGDMRKSVYDPSGDVEQSGGIENYIYQNWVQSDWEAQSSSNLAFIQNRPFYDPSTGLSDNYYGSVVADTGDWRFQDVSTGYYYYGGVISSSFPLNYFSSGYKYRAIVDDNYYDFDTYQQKLFSIEDVKGGTTSTGQFSCLIVGGKFVIIRDQGSSPTELFLGVRYADRLTHSLYLYHRQGDSIRQIERKYYILPDAELVSRKTVIIGPASTHEQYPSAKAVYGELGYKEDLYNKVKTINIASTDSQYPSAKAVYDFVTQKSASVDLGTITLGTTWTGSDPYTQTVTVTGATVTSNSKVDIQPDSSTMLQLGLDGVTALWIENNNGTLTANAMGGYLTVPITIQCTVTEVG